MGQLREAPVFRPSKLDMAGSFEDYIEGIEKKVADIGMCKIIAPAGEKTSQVCGASPGPPLRLYPAI